MADLFARKPLSRLMAEADEVGEHSLKRSLGPWNLVALGIGAIIGAGLFVRTAAAIADRAGPSVVLAFVVAGIGCAFAGLCYAEFASMIPVAGSAYTYSYATMGEFAAWIIGWDLVLEYAVGAATVAIAWSAYANRVLDWFGLRIPYQWSHSPFEHDITNGAARNHEPAGDIHPIIADAAADSRHETIGIRQRDHRHSESHHRLAGDRYRVALYKSGEPHSAHSGADDVCDAARHYARVRRNSRHPRCGGRCVFRLYRVRRGVDRCAGGAQSRNAICRSVFLARWSFARFFTCCFPTCSAVSPLSKISAPRAAKPRLRLRSPNT